MTHGMLPFKYEEEKTQTGMTALAGLPVYMDLANVIGLSKSIKKHLKIRENSQGWTDSQMVLSLVLLNLASGDCVDDLKVLEADEGFCQILRKSETHGLSRKVCRALERRWRKERKRSVPSPSAVFRYLSEFYDVEQEDARNKSEIKAFIPAANEHLKGFGKINKDMIASLNTVSVETTATLDMDATLAQTGFKAYQPFNTWWFEQGIILHTEFRDGNVPAGYEQLRVFQEALDCLPSNVDKVKLQSDTAAYQHDLLRYCEKDDKQLKLPFPTMEIDEETNGEDIIHWLHERCGKSEEVHAVMKDDLAGGKLPSSDFGTNAAWWWIMIIALNLNVMMKNLALASSMKTKRMKAIRFSFINIPGRIIKRSRTLFLRLSKGHPSYNLLVEARRKIAMLFAARAPSG